MMLMEIIGTDKVAAKLGITEAELAAMRDRGEGPKFTMVGPARHRRASYFLNDVTDYLNKEENENG